MAPDLNSLPYDAQVDSSSSVPIQRPHQISINTSGTHIHSANTPSPLSSSVSSLQAAAMMNASLRNASPTADSSQFNRRPSFDPHRHTRQPSLGEIYSSLEQEQEMQVNRLLQQIRHQQEQLAALTRHHRPDQCPSQPTTPSSAAHRPVTPGTHEQSSPLSAMPSSNIPIRPRAPSRQSSRPSTGGSRGPSPALRPVSASLGPLAGDFFLGGRDESSFYKTETQTLLQENQLLKNRIGELERQIMGIEASRHE